LEGHCQDFPNDIRFTKSDEETELKYWIEATGDDPITVWVKVTDDLGTNKDIYVYYGKIGDTTTSNGEDTFLFFDDFDDASIDYGKWTKDIESGTITESGGYLRCGGGSTTAPYGHCSLGSEVGFAAFQNNAVIFRARNSASGIGELAFRGDFGTNVGYKARFDARTGANGNAFLNPPYSGWGFNGGAGCGSDSVIPTADQWYVYEIRVVGTNMKFYKDGALMRDCTDATYSAAGEIALQNHYGDHTDYDWVAVRKYQTTEPAWLSTDSEETSAESIKIEKTLKYCVLKTPSAKTKSLKYTCLKVTAPTKSLKYCVITTPTKKTKTLKYCVLTDTKIEKSLQYEIPDTFDKRGFVYGTSSQSDPGNVAPASSGYDTYVEDTGNFVVGAFEKTLISLVKGQTYYVRAYAHNTNGYSYGLSLIHIFIK